jgi:MFS family permease
MDRRSALVLLFVLGTGVFLAGLELMITAVALPSILADLADKAGTSAWVELRKASWIINGYLLVYILTMPLAGRLADLWGARRLFIGALAIFVAGSALAGAAQDLDQLIVARLVQAAGGGVLVPVGTAAAAHLFGGSARPRARSWAPPSSARSTRRTHSRRPGSVDRRSRTSWLPRGVGSSM